MDDQIRYDELDEEYRRLINTLSQNEEALCDEVEYLLAAFFIRFPKLQISTDFELSSDVIANWLLQRKFRSK